jgi:hypothetical protein
MNVRTFARPRLACRASDRHKLRYHHLQHLSRRNAVYVAVGYEYSNLRCCGASPRAWSASAELCLENTL